MYLRREDRNHSLQPTALVHEAYLRLTHIRRSTGRVGLIFMPSLPR
jgi:hypothetical protein